jgi:hypothetical protein
MIGMAATCQGIGLIDILFALRRPAQIVDQNADADQKQPTAGTPRSSSEYSSARTTKRRQPIAGYRQPTQRTNRILMIAEGMCEPRIQTYCALN